MLRDTGARLFAVRTFRGAAIYGVLALLPLYFVTVPDPYQLTQVGFTGVALAFQGVFWIIGSKPLAYRALIPFAVLEKLAFGVPAVAFFWLGRADPISAAFGGIDLLLAVLFMVALIRLNRLTA